MPQLEIHCQKGREKAELSQLENPIHRLKRNFYNLSHKYL